MKHVTAAICIFGLALGAVSEARADVAGTPALACLQSHAVGCWTKLDRSDAHYSYLADWVVDPATIPACSDSPFIKLAIRLRREVAQQEASYETNVVPDPASVPQAIFVRSAAIGAALGSSLHGCANEWKARRGVILLESAIQYALAVQDARNAASEKRFHAYDDALYPIWQELSEVSALDAILADRVAYQRHFYCSLVIAPHMVKSWSDGDMFPDGNRFNSAPQFERLACDKYTD